MSNAGRTRSASRSSKRSLHDIPPPPPPHHVAATPQWNGKMEPCAASASFFVYAQKNVILCLHHDTLAVERRFERHTNDVAWVVIDNVSDIGAGRLVVSYDVGQIAIVWDLMTGDEVARFESFEDLRSAAWMKNGNVAFGNSTGNIILFEPSTKEHLSTKTIYDPVTALAPALDNQTFAIGYQNGSIMIARLQPRFEILHMPHSRLQNERSGSIVGLAWHGSSAKQKSDMLGSQTADGDILIWTIPKIAHGDSATVIRDLGKFQGRGPSPCWFGWSKTGRIVQYQEGETQTHDVRTKKIVSTLVPTIDNVIGMCNFGATATLFTIGIGHTVQQYDITPNGTPVMVASVHHVLTNLPPTPPSSTEVQRAEEKHRVSSIGASMPVFLDALAISEDEVHQPVSLAQIARQSDSIDFEELRDQVPPLASPVSSKSSIATRSTGRRSDSRSGSRSRPSDRSRNQTLLSSNRSMAPSEGTMFSLESLRSGSQQSSQASVSSRSVSSSGSSRHGSSRLRHQVLRSPDEVRPAAASTSPSVIDLFPYTRARLNDVPFTNPTYQGLSVDDLRCQMLSIVLGWDEDIEDLIRYEHAQHRAGTSSSVLLNKWLGEESEADMSAQILGSDSMSQMDWMLLALSNMGNSQKKVAETFVQRLLEKGDVHHAVAILIGLGEHNDAIEVYVSRKKFMEAVLLTCLIYPRDWQRISHLVRRWGETAVAAKQPELAVRCFSCTSMEASDAYLSPRAAQDAAYAAQQAHIMGALSPPLSPPTSATSATQRIRRQNAGLKLVTSFNDQAASGVTPIDGMSAISPGGRHLRTARPDPHTAGPDARTATPGGFARRRMPSRTGIDRVPTSDATPMATKFRSNSQSTTSQSGRSETRHSRAHSRSSAASMSSDRLPLSDSYNRNAPMSPGGFENDRSKIALPSPAHSVFDNYRTRAPSRNGSRVRKPDGLSLELSDKVVEMGLESSESGYLTATTNASSVSRMTAERIPIDSIASPPLTGASMLSTTSLGSTKVRAIDNYVSSLQEANFHAQQQRAIDKKRASSRPRAESRGAMREPSQDREARPREPRGRSGVRYIKSSKRSPSSPVSMSPDDPALQLANQMFDAENFYRVTSPIEARGRSNSKARGTSKQRSSSKVSRRAESPRSVRASRPSSRARPAKPTSRRGSPERVPQSATRGRSITRGEGSIPRSPSSPLPMTAHPRLFVEESAEPDAAASDDSRAERTRSRTRQRSSSRRAGARSGSSRRDASPDRNRPRERSVSRHPGHDAIPEVSEDDSPERAPVRPQPRSSSKAASVRAPISEVAPAPRALTQKERAAKELEERRLSLARRPSAPQIPHPDEIEKSRSPLHIRSPVHEPLSSAARMQLSGTPDHGVTGTSTSSVPIGLPANPKAMRHHKYMNSESKDGNDIPAIPEIPSYFAQSKTDDAEEDELTLLLPATTYKAPSVPRSASVPTESFFGRQSNETSGNSGNERGRGHTPKASTGGSPLNGDIASIDQTIAKSDVVIIEEPASEPDPPLLPELQHLAGPPPPPPPPAPTLQQIEDATTAPDRRATPAAMMMTGTTLNPPTDGKSPYSHRRGRGSMSDSVGSKVRNLRDRMRSTSRNRVRSPANDDLTSLAPSPYESVLPPMHYVHARKDSLGRAASPQTHPAPYESIIPPMPSGAVGAEQGGELRSQTNTPFQGYRTPKEIRANMPPEHLQMGAYSQ